MKILHVPFGYYPDAVGGTEIYVNALTWYLREMGLEQVVAAPSSKNAKYEFEGISVHRFAKSEKLNLRELYGTGDTTAAENFGRVLEEVRPDLVHLHSFTSAVSVLTIKEVKKRHIPLVYTYHTPTASCQRGSLLRWGSQECDGKIRIHTCAKCTLQGLGVPRVGAELLGSLPPALGKIIPYEGDYFTAWRMTCLIGIKKEVFQCLIDEADAIIAVSRWVKQVLKINGANPSKIYFLRQGIFNEQSTIEETVSQSTPLRIVYLGRITRDKGIHLILEAMKMDKALNVLLDIYGIIQEVSTNPYLQKIMQMIKNDSRVRILNPVSSRDVPKILKQYDVIAVPSKWFESGPMVVLEAQAAGIPVLGTNLGGISELVTHNENGLLMAASPKAWLAELKNLTENPLILKRLKKGIRPPKTMKKVAEEMHAIYLQVLERYRLSNE
jgi:glycosyltransferase involved in cell wall biosynthesis